MRDDDTLIFVFQALIAQVYLYRYLFGYVWDDVVVIQILFVMDRSGVNIQPGISNIEKKR